MTKQDFLDLLARTSRAGGFPSDNSNTCLYRTDDGRKCPVGLLIPDEKYCRDMEEKGADELFGRFPELLDHLPDGMTVADLGTVQDIHDRRSTHRDGWNHRAFVDSLLALDCFWGLSPRRMWVVHLIRDKSLVGSGLVAAATPEEAVQAEKRSLEELENGKAGWHHEPGEFWPLHPGDYFAVTAWQDDKAEPDPTYT